MKVSTREESRTPDDIAAEVRNRREQAGVKQVTLAQLAGVNERTIQRLERGQRVDEQTLCDVATALGLDSEAFLCAQPRTVKPTMQKYFEELLAFDLWANEAILTWMESHPENPELVHTFAHLIAENHPWLYVMRCEPVPADVNPVPNWSLRECREQFAPTMDGLAAFVASCGEEDFGKIVRSDSPTGLTFEHTIMEVLTNLLGHSEHHRGQMVSEILRETGEYVPTVYMSYLRSRG